MNNNFATLFACKGLSGLQPRLPHQKIGVDYQGGLLFGWKQNHHSHNKILATSADLASALGRNCGGGIPRQNIGVARFVKAGVGGNQTGPKC